MAGNQILLGLPHHLVGSFGFQTVPQLEMVYSAAAQIPLLLRGSLTANLNRILQ